MIKIYEESIYTITLKLDQRQALDLWQSIYECSNTLDNWRSNPGILLDLMRLLKEATGSFYVNIA